MNKNPNTKDQATPAMTQEDVLRELELLPMWHLRAGLTPLAPEAHAASPVPVVPAAHVAAPVLTEQVLQEPVVLEPVIPEPVIPEPVLPEPVAAMAWTQVASTDGLCLFVTHTVSLSADEWQLLQNMAKAMRISLSSPQPMTDPDHALSASPAKMLIAFGAAAAQQLLASQASLPTLRGQLHACHGRTLVATHALDHLLQQPLDKAQTWHDLRLAMQALADLA
jgi:uracil-DNA glycosylase